MRGQRIQREDMRQHHRKHLDAVLSLLAFDHGCERKAKLQLAKLPFDLDLPRTDDAQEHRVLRLGAKRQCNLRELRGVAIPPDEGVRIE